MITLWVDCEPAYFSNLLTSGAPATRPGWRLTREKRSTFAGGAKFKLAQSDSCLALFAAASLSIARLGIIEGTDADFRRQMSVVPQTSKPTSLSTSNSYSNCY